MAFFGNRAPVPPPPTIPVPPRPLAVAPPPRPPAVTPFPKPPGVVPAPTPFPAASPAKPLGVVPLAKPAAAVPLAPPPGPVPPPKPLAGAPISGIVPPPKPIGIVPPPGPVPPPKPLAGAPPNGIVPPPKPIGSVPPPIAPASAVPQPTAPTATKTLASQPPTELVTQNLLFAPGDARNKQTPSPVNNAAVPQGSPAAGVSPNQRIGSPAVPIAQVPQASPLRGKTIMGQPGVAMGRTQMRQVQPPDPPRKRNWLMKGEPTVSIAIITVAIFCYVMAGVMSLLYTAARK